MRLDIFELRIFLNMLKKRSRFAQNIIENINFQKINKDIWGRELEEKMIKAFYIDRSFFNKQMGSQFTYVSSLVF